MKKATFILTSILAVLAAWLLIQKCGTDTKTAELKEEMTFVVSDIDDVKKILVASRSKKPAVLERRGNRWFLDGKIPANPYVMEGILDVLEQARIQYIPSQTEVDKLMPIMATKGIKVEAYDGEGGVLLSYYIGAVTQTEKGTHFYKEGGDRSYVMEMPYGQVNIRQRFDIRYDDWKDRVIFNDRVEDVERVTVRYPKSPANGFVISRSGNDFEIQPVIPDQPEINRPLKDDIFEKYLVTYKGVNFVEFNNQVIGKDSVMNNTPFMTSELINTDGDTFSLTLWPKTMDISTPVQAHRIDNPINGYYAIDHKGDFGTVQQIVVRGTIAGYPHFFK